MIFLLFVKLIPDHCTKTSLLGRRYTIVTYAEESKVLYL